MSIFILNSIRHDTTSILFKIIIDITYEMKFYEDDLFLLFLFLRSITY
jgi:hypothetical protein